MDYGYEFQFDKFYCYPDSNVFKNKLNITDSNQLKKAEREITSLKTAQILTTRIKGNFDFTHLCKIHNFLFSDIYEWAGQIRVVDISKGSLFCKYEFIEKEADKLFKELKDNNYIKNCKDKNDLIKQLAYYLGEINAIHPFREGNGRCQRIFIEHLSFHLGYNFDFMKITPKEMMEASIESFNGNNTKLELSISKALTKI